MANRVSNRLFNKFTAEELAAMPPETLRAELDLIEQEVLEEMGARPVPCAYAAVGPTDYRYPPEPYWFDVSLIGLKEGASKIKVIQRLRSLTNLSLIEARDIVNQALSSGRATIKEGLSKADAEKIKAFMEAVGTHIFIEGRTG